MASQQSQQPDPTKPFAHILSRQGRYKYLAKEHAVLFEETGNKVPWATVYKRLTEVAAAGSSGSSGTSQSKPTKQPASQPTKQTTKAGTTLSTFTDSTTGQEATIESGEATKLTPPDLQNASIAAHRRIVETRSTRNNANTKYKVQPNPQAVFKAGSVIELLYPDYSSGESAITPTRDYGGEWRMRRFVIIEPRHTQGHSAALPISTYNGQGVAKRGVIRQHHVIIYTGPTPPRPTAQEGPARLANGDVDTLRPTPIQVIPAHPTSALDPMSRLNLTEHYVIDHHVEIYLFGSVAPQSLTPLLYQFRDANAPPPRGPSAADRPPPDRPSAGPSTGSRRQADDDDDDDDDEDPEVVNLALRVRGFNDPDKAKQALANLKRHDEANNRDMYPRVIAYLRRTANR